MARPKKSDAALDKVVGVRIDSATLAAWSALARASETDHRRVGARHDTGLPALVTRPAPAPAAGRGPGMAGRGVNRCGNNLNQIARAANRSGIQGQELRALLARLIDIERRLAAALRHDD